MLVPELSLRRFAIDPGCVKSAISVCFQGSIHHSRPQEKLRRVVQGRAGDLHRRADPALGGAKLSIAGSTVGPLGTGEGMPRVLATSTMDAGYPIFLALTACREPRL